MESSERMREPGMLRRLVGKIGEAELAYPPEPLEFARVDERYDELPFGRIRIDADNVVNRIAINSFGQVLPHRSDHSAQSCCLVIISSSKPEAYQISSLCRKYKIMEMKAIILEN